MNPTLLKYLSTLTQGKEKRDTPLKFLVPLCGKTKDIPFLLNLGFHVVGIEGVASVIQELAEENNIPLEYDSQAQVYHNTNRSLQVYCGDLFKCPVESFGPYDCIWDRGSLIALDYKFRPSYMATIKRALKSSNSYKYLLQAIVYDKTKFGGPPSCVTEQDVTELYSDWTEVKFLESVNVIGDHSYRHMFDEAGYFDKVTEQFYLISPKKN